MKQLEQSTILTYNYEGHEIRSMLREGHVYIAQSDLLAVLGHETLFSNERVITDLLTSLGNEAPESIEKVVAIAEYLHEQGLISGESVHKISSETRPLIVSLKWRKNQKEESHND